MPLNEIALERLEGWKTAAMEFAPLLMGEPFDTPLAELRRRYDQELARNLPPEGVSIAQVDMGGVPGTLVTPEGVKGDRALLYLHGGGYLTGSPSGYHGIAGHYAKMLGARVYLPDYRLAPEHPFPAALEDSLAAYRWLADHVGDTRNIVFAGDSAGGAMVVSTMVKARNASFPLPAGGVAISPWANLEMTGASYISRDGIDPLCNREILVLMARRALGGTLPNDPDASPVFADVRGLPPILVQVGESEVMLSDAMRLATHLADNRVRTSLEVWPGMFHVWPMFAGVLPEGLQALESASIFLDRVLDQGRAGR
ncbi:MAG: alpha/beta hydrolase [Phenylobacterium sp.]|uniref:alpha/beta hydrolase n=1 Tax=Phenylobacterium sp. TaxID=1871053 RepID=UPI002736BACF|nr:alpha/beta hydrolase [Phenylobacterium sp.]MDP3747396.1 alpha/beta hydrolase [Phenylobacterium sp.]